jgi:hypothetical protein
MNRALLFACALVLMPACSSASSEANQPPTAHVPTISREVTYGEWVQLSGYGTDEDGEVVGYLWRSEAGGELSRSAAFETDSLPVGEHVLYFAVQDNDGDWSEEVRQFVSVRPAVVAPPKINSFAASKSTIRMGESVTLSWVVSGATMAGIDHGIGTVPESGSVVVSPAATTTYGLTATGGGGTASASVTVTVDPVQSIVLTPSVDLSGYVRFSGYAPYREVYVGDDQADRGIRGFLTYYITDIPDDATIARVIVDMSGYQALYDNPFTGLGCLSAFEHPYNTLQGQYRVPGLPGAIHEWCSLPGLDAPVESIGIRNALQARLGEDRFQFRLQFADMETDKDMQRDLLSWGGIHLPTLTVEYYLDEL